MDAATDSLLREYANLAKQSTPAAQANLIAGEATHTSWRMPGGPLFFARARGVRKWDGAGRPYIDLWMGHGSLLLGNAHPLVVEAIAKQAGDGQHVGGAHVLQLEWAARIKEHVPSCERVRFTSSGTEATLLALRIARASTGRPRVLRVDGHFHGWHDESLAHSVPETAGLNPGIIDSISVVPPNDVSTVADELEACDVAALILEPGGGSAGSLPWSSDYLRALRRDHAGTILIFDEIISGFRYAPGGVQGLAGVVPDLTVLSKIAAGGMPGALVGGRAEVMETLSDAGASGRHFVVPHSGTFNGFPLTAAAALITLGQIADGAAQARAEGAALVLVQALNEAARAADIDVRAFHESSIFHLLVGARRVGAPVAPGPAAVLLPQKHADLHVLLRCALLLEGVDCHSSHGWLSAIHSRDDIEEAVGGFTRAFTRLRHIDAFRLPEPIVANADDGCGPVCRNPACGVRSRLVGGCSLPLAYLSNQNDPR